jgi:uncharacterized protein (TIGR04255 family)
VGRDTLVVNLIRGSEPYEGFEYLLQAALAQFDRFLRVFRPQNVMRVALHYTDVVRIPRPADSPLALEDYFRLGIKVPEEATWIVGRIAIELGISLATSTSQPDELMLSFRREPTPTGAGEDRFRMDWHAICQRVDTKSATVLSNRLSKVHGALRKRFRDCFTARTWALFNEEG